MPSKPHGAGVGSLGTILASDLRRRRVQAGDGAAWPIEDVGLDLAAGDYPAVRRVYARGPAGERWTIPWESLDPSHVATDRLALRPGHEHRRTTEAEWGRDVLLLRDVLDAQVIDTRAKHVLRANDLVLTVRSESVELTALDASPGAVLRRLTRGIIRGRPTAMLVDWKDVEF